MSAALIKINSAMERAVGWDICGDDEIWTAGEIKLRFPSKVELEYSDGDANSIAMWH